ncbi:aspartate aminotransferase [Xylaria intraflava]|nr:aspartate aminotransferase [Xylaria intraflava]
MSLPFPFANISEPRLETLNALEALHREDPSPVKANLMIGVYRDDNGNPFLLPSVKRARQKLYDSPNWTHEYPPSHLGTQDYRDLSAALFFGADSQIFRDGRIASMQCLGASGACHMGALFLKKYYEPLKDGKSGKIYIPRETWANHPNVFHHVGFETESLPWYSSKTNSLDIDALITGISALPPSSVIVLQTAGNNPTGCDPSAADWARIADCFVAGHHLAFLDAAYPGFVTGDFEKDCEPIRIFADAGIPLLLATTYGKAFGLYGERVGTLFITMDSNDSARRVEGHMKLLARAETGAQPSFGAAIVQTILSDRDLRRAWQEDLAHMASELNTRRHRLFAELQKLDGVKDWSFIRDQAGMFTYTGLDAEQITLLREEHHVYLQDTGRLSIAGLNSTNLHHVAASLHAATRVEDSLPAAAT